MPNLREYVVCLHNYEDLESFYYDMETPGGNLHIPDRIVEISNRRPLSRNTYYRLTAEEAELIAKDPRVKFVELSEAEQGIVAIPSITQTSSNWNKSKTINNQQYNWGLLRITEGNKKPNWGINGTTTVSGTIDLPYTGSNVDVLIVDGHIVSSHPEFAVNSNGSGGSRFVPYNWYQHNPEVTGGAAENYSYSDPTYNFHATHVAGIAAGNRHGWARTANIYNLSFLVTGSSVFDYIRAWHTSKPVNPVTGRKNPTVVNCSFETVGFQAQLKSWTDITQVVYRGTTYNGPFTRSQLENYGFVFNNNGQWLVPTQPLAYTQDLIDLINVGAIVCIAAGNTWQKIAQIGDQDWNNVCVVSGVSINYNRGSFAAPVANAIIVGGISDKVEEYKLFMSAAGPRVDIFAPAESINSSWPNSSNPYNDPNWYAYEPANPVLDERGSGYNFKLSGTSMAAPQVTGVIAALMQQNQNWTPAQAQGYIQFTAGTGQLSNNPDIASQYNLQGSVNRALYYSTTGTPPANTSPIYNITPESTQLGEGDTLWISIETQNVNDGATVYWKIVGVTGTITAEDFAGNTLKGSITITDGGAFFSIGPLADSLTEGPESFKIVISEQEDGAVVGETATITILDTSQAPATKTYAITATPTQVDEGGTITVTITTTNVSNGTTLYWKVTKLVNSDITGDDFSDLVVGPATNLEGSIQINNNSATFTKTIRADNKTEGDEFFVITISETPTGEAKATTPTILIKDTSLSPTIEVYNISADKTSVNEGEIIEFTVDTLNVPNNTILYWRIESSTVNSSDFDFAPVGTVIINNNVGIFNLRPRADSLTEEDPETFDVILSKTDNGVSVARIDNITIVDTSQTTKEKSYSIAPNKQTLVEGDTVTFLVTTANVANGEKLYWVVNGAVSQDDFDNITSSTNLSFNAYLAESNNFGGEVTINNNQGSFSLTAKADIISEVLEQFSIQLGQFINGTLSQTVNSVSISIVDKYKITANKSSSVNRGDLIEFSIETVGVANDTVLYWNNIGTATASDFSQNITTGTVQIVGNTGTITLNVLPTAAIGKTVQIQLRSVSSTGTVVAESLVIQIAGQVSTYQVLSSATQITEGSTATFVVTTENVDDNTVLYWKNIGTSKITDFENEEGYTYLGFNISGEDPRPHVGSVTISNNTGIISLVTKKDLLTENTLTSETIILELRTDPASSSAIATSNIVSITDSSKTPTYTITSNANTVYEGTTATFTIVTTNIEDGKELEWEVIGLSEYDIDELSNIRGVLTITNSTAVFSLTIAENEYFENEKSFLVVLRNYEQSRNPVAVSDIVKVINNDQLPTYSISISNSPFIIDDTIGFNVNVSTTNIKNNTVLYWNNIGTTNSSDFASGTDKGTIVISNNQASFSLIKYLDSEIEGNEEVQIELRSESHSGDILTISNIVIFDDSGEVYSPTYTITSNQIYANLGTTAIFTVYTTEFSTGTLYYSISAPNSSIPNQYYTGGTVSISNGTGNIILPISESLKENLNSVVVIDLRTNSNIGPVVANSRPLLILPNPFNLEVDWNTASSIGTVPEVSDVFIEFSNLPSDSLTKIISGELPPGLVLNVNGTITGKSPSVNIKTKYRFVVRAYNTGFIEDKTFDIDIAGEDYLAWVTPSGYLPIGINSEQYAINNQYVDFQLEAILSEHESSTSVKYFINEYDGILPPGLRLTSDGKIVGFLTDVLTFSATDSLVVGYDTDLYSSLPYERGPITTTDDQYIGYPKIYQFFITATDGIMRSRRYFKVLVVSPEMIQDPTKIGIQLDPGILVQNPRYIPPLQFIRSNNLGIIRAENYKIFDVSAYDPYPGLGIVRYSTDSELPNGLMLDAITGTLYGFIPYQPAYSKSYNIKINAVRLITDTHSVITSNTFTLTIKGNVETSLSWVTKASLGTITAGETSELLIRAVHSDSNYSINYQIIGGTLPSGLTLLYDGSIAGSVDYGITGNFTFTVAARDNYRLSSIEREFNLTVVEYNNKTFTKVYAKPFLAKSKRNEYLDFISNDFTFDPLLIYRPLDYNFGVQQEIKLFLEFGIEQLNIEDYIPALEQNFYKKHLYFGDIKSAIAIDNSGHVLYEVVYVDIDDNLTNSSGVSVNQSITANNNTYYPASIDNMRARLEHIRLDDNSLISVNEFNLPKFMRTAQPGEYITSGYISVMPICYALPGQGHKIISRIKLSGFDFKQYNFEIDRIIVENSLDNQNPRYIRFGKSNI